MVLWHAHDRATNYIIYRALSVNAPWVEVAKKEDKDVRAFGGYKDVTELALANDLCYKVDAVTRWDNSFGFTSRSVCQNSFTGRRKGLLTKVLFESFCEGFRKERKP
jgi:hypothetical protein